MVRDVAAYRLNAWACPRGSAKSTILGTEVPLFLLVTRQNFSILLILAKQKMVEKRLGRMMEQLEENPYIQQDFGVLKPKRGGKMWNHSILQLTNGSELTGMPVEGKMLGERPDMVLIDDAEHDKALSSDPNPAYLREAFDRLLQGTLYPMLRRGSCLGWIGTLLDARSFLWKFVHSREQRIVRYWNRRNLAAITDTGKSIWEEYWPTSHLEMLRDSMDDEYWQTHFMNNPGQGRAGLLKIDPVFCTYEVDPETEWWQGNPLVSESTLVSNRPVIQEGDGVEVDSRYEAEICKRPLGETVGAMHRVVLVDFGFSVKTGADYSCAHVVGYENNEKFRSTIWSLDLWLGRLPTSQVIQKVWEYARKWQVRMIAAEAVAQQQQIVEQIQELVEKQAGDWRPIVLPLKYKVGGREVKKEDRIAALGWWFDRFRVKLPVQRRHTWPYRELFLEINRFSLPRAGTPHDDAVDTLSMFPYTMGGSTPRTGPAEPGEKKLDAIEQIKRGELVSEAGIPYISMLDPGEIPVEALRKIRREQQEKQAQEQGDKVIWMPA
jgi:hypothetical protein